MGMLCKAYRRLEDKEYFSDELRHLLDAYSVDYLVVCLADFNRHVGRHIDGFDGRYFVGQDMWKEECW